MINQVMLLGRLTKNPELKKTESNKSVLNFTLAIKDAYNKEKTEFIDCVAWNQSADFLAQYAGQGDLISCEGRIAKRVYESQYGKRYITEVVCSRVAIEAKKKDSPAPNMPASDELPPVEECPPDYPEYNPMDYPATLDNDALGFYGG